HHRLRGLSCSPLPHPGPALRGRGDAPRRGRRPGYARPTSRPPHLRGGDVKVLIWHVHGSWTTAFVQGAHTYVVPVVEDRGPDGRGRAETWDWPANVVECAPEALADEDIDVVVLQRPIDEKLAIRWLGRRPG